jgi:hypothetical protein
VWPPETRREKNGKAGVLVELNIRGVRRWACYGLTTIQEGEDHMVDSYDWNVEDY